MTEPAQPHVTTTPIAMAMQHLEQGRWEAAHATVQSESGALAAWVHGIVHLVEGDLDNARYWYGRAARAWPDAPAPGVEIAALRTALANHEPEVDR